jgi:hypothetical protein
MDYVGHLRSWCLLLCTCEAGNDVRQPCVYGASGEPYAVLCCLRGLWSDLWSCFIYRALR